MSSVTSIRQGVILVFAQGASSIGNLAMSILIARESTVGEFVGYALALPIYVVAQRLFRVYLQIPRQIEAHHPDGRQVGARGAATLWGSFALAGLVALLGLASQPPIGSWLVALAVLVPGLMMYDVIRNEYLVAERTGHVAAMDICWLVLQITGSAIVYLINVPPIGFLVVWGCSALVVAGSFSAHTTGRLGLRVGVRQLVSHVHLMTDALSDLLATVLVVQAVPYLVALIGSLDVAAGLRGGQTLLGPVNVALMGLLPMVQMRSAAAGDVWSLQARVARAATIAVALICLPYGLAASLLPDDIGLTLLGDTWSVTARMMTGLAALLVMGSPQLVVFTVLRSAGAHRHLAMIRLVTAALVLIGAAAGAVVSGYWVAWGMAIGAGLGTALSFGTLRIARRRSMGSARPLPHGVAVSDEGS